MDNGVALDLNNNTRTLKMPSTTPFRNQASLMTHFWQELRRFGPKHFQADQSLEGKLTVPRVREAIRVLGATFFASMTGLKTQNKTKVYDAATLHVVHLEDPTTADGLLAADEAGNEEDFIEALMQEGEDEDALLVADFEALAADTIQEDSELAQAFNAYSDARRRLSQKIRNRGFWPTSKSSQQKGKGFGGKSFGHRGKGGYQQQRPKKRLQDRIMKSNCRACGRKGHWKAEFPCKSAASAASTTSGGTSAPTSTAILDDDALHSILRTCHC